MKLEEDWEERGQTHACPKCGARMSSSNTPCHNCREVERAN